VAFVFGAALITAGTSKSPEKKNFFFVNFVFFVAREACCR